MTQRIFDLAEGVDQFAVVGEDLLIRA